MHLVTIPFSHYCERARWALDHFGVPFTESGYLPMFHMAGVLWATRGRPGRADRTSSPLSTPLLITDDGTRIHDSTRILHWADQTHGDAQSTLYPAEHREAIEAIEQQVHDRLGPHTRRLAYVHLLPQRTRLLQTARAVVGPAQAMALRVLLPLWRAGMRRALQLTAERAESSRAALGEQLAELDEVLGDRSHLVGERFTAADLTVACMLIPVLLPRRAEGYSVPLPPRETVSTELRSLVEEVRATRIGRHALRMFGQERRKKPDSANEVRAG